MSTLTYPWLGLLGTIVQEFAHLSVDLMIKNRRFAHIGLMIYSVV